MAAQALPELKPDVAQLRGAGGVAADAEYKCTQHAAFGEAVPSQLGGQVLSVARAYGPSGIRVFPHQRHCFLPLRRQSPPAAPSDWLTCSMLRPRTDRCAYPAVP